MAQVGPYEVHEELGRGGMGSVFRAVDRRTGLAVALKVLAAQDERSRRRLVLEARALGRLRHRNVVALLDAGEEQGRPWLAMELVRGRSLQQRLDQEGPLPPREAARLLQGIAAGLAHAHREGVLHRDLKPANVLLPDDGGEARLTDFGLAGFEFELSQSRLTRSGLISGSPGYWSPEQAAGKASAIGQATDVYGLGALLYATLTGRAPIAGASLPEVLVATAEQRPAAPGADPALDALALRCLEKRPEDRPASVEAVARELARYLAGRAARRGPGRRLLLVALGAAAVAATGLAWTLRPPAAVVEAPPPVPGPERLPPGVRAGERPGEWVNEKDGSVLVWVPAGRFRMGTDGGPAEDGPAHEVRLTQGYLFGKHEVTWGQYRAYCREVGRTPPSSVIELRDERFEGGDRHPVNGVSWDEAQAYCAWAGLRLPTEAEWEHAARGPDGRAFPWGDAPPDPTRCNKGADAVVDEEFRDGSDGHLFPSPVGSHPAGASPFGALDLAGNLWEWCQDAYAPYGPDAAVDPTGPAPGTAVLRGGSWADDRTNCSATHRFAATADSHTANIGFRVARSAPAAVAPPRPADGLPAGVVPGERPGEYVNEKDGSVLVRVPAGSFRMGSDAIPEAAPAHEVRLTRGYFLGKHEVTWGQYRAFCQERGRPLPSTSDGAGGGFQPHERHPVFMVTWDDAQAYCLWAGLRLPTEAEWEHAARGSDGRTYPWGEEPPGRSLANVGRWERPGDGADTLDDRDGFLHHAPVGSYGRGASPFGCLDLAGNVTEWCADWYVSGFARTPAVDPAGPPAGGMRVGRGGSWSEGPSRCRAAFRYGYPPTWPSFNLGFRVARSEE